VIKFTPAKSLTFYRHDAIASSLARAHAAIMALSTTPFSRDWVEKLQRLELKREIAGTTRIEGAQFAEGELELALKETAEQLNTRSQRQAHATLKAYKWIAAIPDDRPIDATLIREVHRLIVVGADDDHCEPGVLRKSDQNVTFGNPPHRGAEGGEQCNREFQRLVEGIRKEFRDHDPLIQAFAAHYHFAAIHPFSDGNGRTARALQALLLQRAGLKESWFISMANYFHEEQQTYLATLAKVGQANGDLTDFLNFGLEGIVRQSMNLLNEVKLQISKALFKGVMYDLFNRMKTPKKRVIAGRQIETLKLLLENGFLTLDRISDLTKGQYAELKVPRPVLMRDLNNLIQLGAISAEKDSWGKIGLRVNLEWPTKITETEFFKHLAALPKAKTHPFLR
jgi:Fic family protein